MNRSTIKRRLLALAMAVGMLTIVPAISSFTGVTEALSERSDVPPSIDGGVTVVPKNGDTPDWIAELLEQERNSGLAGVSIDQGEGLSI